MQCGSTWQCSSSAGSSTASRNDDPLQTIRKIVRGLHYKGQESEFRMSFGFSIGDFIAVLELGNKIRKDFAAAPAQFKDISDEYVC